MKAFKHKMYNRLFQFGLLSLLIIGTSISVGCRSVDDTGDSVEVAYLDITPATSSMVIGDSVQFSVTGVYTNTTAADFSNSAGWSSSNTSVAVFSSNTPGLITAIAVGTTTVTATAGGVSKAFTIAVVALQSIQVTPANSSLPLGLVQQYTATGVYSDGSTNNITGSVEWSSADTSLIIVDNSSSKGLARGLSTGTVAIKAISNGITGSTDVTVTAVTLSSIEIYPINETIEQYTKKKYVATGVFSDNSVLDITDAVTWTSSNESIVRFDRSSGSASVQANGVAAGGPVTIKAIYGNVSGTTSLTVNSGNLDSIVITPVDPSVALYGRISLKATGIFDTNTSQDLTEYIDWRSSNNTVAIVSNVNSGVLDAIATGSATIEAVSTLNGGKTDVSAVTVTNHVLDSIQIYPPDLSLAVGSSQRLRAVGIYTDNTIVELTNQVTWVSLDTETLIVDNSNLGRGVVSGIKTGQVFLFAILPGSSKGGSASITITNAALTAIEVTPENADVVTQQQFTATGIFTDGSTQDLTHSVLWDSSNDSYIAVSNSDQHRGLATTVSAGSTSIRATLGSISGSTTVSVSSAILNTIQITPINPSLAPDYQIQLTATGIYSDNSAFDLTNTVTWKSDATDDVVISNAEGSSGLATARSTGSATVTAHLGALSSSTVITTTNATLSAIEVTPTNSVCIPGGIKNFTATGIFSDRSIQDLTAFVVWKSTEIETAKINNSLVNRGSVDCIKAGVSIVTAAKGVVSGSTSLTVLDVLTSFGDN